MTKDKKPLTFEELREKVKKRLSKRPYPRKHNLSDITEKQQRRYLGKAGIAFQEAVFKLLDEDTTNSMAGSSSTATNLPANTAAISAVERSTDNSEFYCEDDGMDCSGYDDEPMENVTGATVPSSIWEQYKDRLVELYLAAIASGKTSVGLECPEVPASNCACIKSTRNMRIYTLSSNSS